MKLIQTLAKESIRECRHGVCRAGLVALALWLLAPKALALDPGRALTQALLRKWQFQQGLPQSTIFAICQTANRYLWLGTQSGLYRFDGVRFSAAPHGGQIALNSLWITDLCEDHDRNLWIATNDSGVVRLHDGVAERYGVDEGLPSEHVRRLLVDRHGDLWAGTDDGLALWIEVHAKFSRYRSPQQLPAHDVRALCEAQDGTVWIGGDGNRLTFWDGSNLSSRVLASLSPRGSVHALLGASDGSLWAGTTAGLIHVTPGEEKRITRADGLADDEIECLAQSPDGTVWVGTRDGMSRLRGDDIECLRTRDGLSQSTVYTLCEDHEGGLWVGTKHGLNHFIDRRTIPLTMSEGLPSNDAGPILEDLAGTVWVGTLGKGLARSDGRRCTPALTAATGLPSDTIVALEDGGSGELWIGTNRGLCLVREGRVEQIFSTEHGLPSDVVTCLLRDHAGVLWVGTAGGVARLDSGGFVQPDGDPDELHLPILAVVDRGVKGLVVSTEEGRLFQCLGHRLRPLALDGFAPQDVDAFYLDRDGLLWMGMRGGGVAMADGEKTFRFTVKDGLYDDEVFGIVADNDDRLWMACSRGIFSVSRAELLDRAAGKIARFTCAPFSPIEAQRTVEAQSGVQPVMRKMRDGSIWFSTIHGVIILDPAHMRRNLPPPAVVVEETQVNGQDVNPARVPQLRPGPANLYFRYTALSYASPTRITFRHKLEGFDKDWIEAGSRREAFYTNIPPGGYKFRVSAANLDAPWNETEHPVEITLEPRFYQTRWFIPLIVAGVAFAGWVVSRLRVLQVKSRMNAVVAERSRIARELHDTLIQGFSGVTMQMQGLAARLRASPERETLVEIIQDAGHCLSEARRSVGGLRRAPTGEPGNPTGLAAAVAQAARQLTETADVRLALRLAQTQLSLLPDVEYNVLRIAQEAITNAVKHSGAGTIEVTLDSTIDRLRLTIHDDGTGFSENDREPAQSGHYGLIGMRERATQIHGDLSLESAPGVGTTVCLELNIAAARNGTTAAIGDGAPRRHHGERPGTDVQRES